MKIIRKKCFDIFYDETSDRAKAFVDLITKKRRLVVPEKLVIVAGGDGTMLSALHHYNFKGIFLGVNCGHRGYLLNDNDDTINKITNKEYCIHRFPLIEVKVNDSWSALALEVYFNRIGPKTCRTKVVVSGDIISERIAGDGIDIATALAASGYFTPISKIAVHPKLPVICYAPIIPNPPSPKTDPRKFPLASVFEITLLSPPEEVKGWCDGVIELPRFQYLKVSKSRKTFRLAFWKNVDFDERLAEAIRKIQGGE